MELLRGILLFTSVLVIAAQNTCDKAYEACIVDNVLAKINPQINSLKDENRNLKTTVNNQKTQIEELQQREPFKCESGTVSGHGHTLPWPVNKNVVFKTPFEQAPTLTYGLYLLDTYKGDNLRIRTDVSNVTNAGFAMKLSNWDGSRVYGAYNSWMACGI
uniref:Uncharacterized protein LOC111114199 n=1 Tax=Crassostrea virginica TaxID=6565 RepID=A0A8B8BXS8_CRAVI|nr:uncharacterized protein LOC111114199 [Crassostrea virginica]